MYKIYNPIHRIQNESLGQAKPRQRDIRNLTALYQSGHLAEAEEKAKSLIERFPQALSVHRILSAALASQGKFSEAAASLQRVIEIDPGQAEMHNNLGVVLVHQGRLTEAVASYNAALSIRPEYPDAYVNLGVAMIRGGDPQGAVSHFERALQVDALSAAAYGNMGDAWQKMGRPDKAVELCNRSLKISPNNGAVHSFLGNALRDQGDLEGAAASYRRALDFITGIAELHCNFGGILLDLGARDEAIASYKRALEINPDVPEAHFNLGNAFWAHGRHDEALQHYDSAGTREAAATALERLYTLGRLDEFNARLRVLCEADPDNIYAATVSAFAAHQLSSNNIFPFCKDPLRFVHVEDISSRLGSLANFTDTLLKESGAALSVWQPPGKTTNNGFQTSGDLFAFGTPSLERLKYVILEQVENYRAKFAGAADGLVSRWPRKSKLTGWHVRLLSSGYQDAHVHPTGWLSGVFYVRVPNGLGAGEGDIEFSLHGYDLPVRSKDIPTRRHSPKAGELVLFPSSLFHRTTPFVADDERHCIAFDLEPLFIEGH